MIDESGNEVYKMSKAEAIASVKEMGDMMDFFNGTCEHCGGIRRNCSAECVEAQVLTHKDRKNV